MPAKIINPNFHVILIHYPLGLLIAGTLIELFSFLWKRSSFRMAGRWMILVGALSTVPAVFSGIYALQDIARQNNPADVDALWVVVRDASPLAHQGPAWHMLVEHTLYESIASGVVMLVVVLWLAMSDRARRTWHWPLLGGLLLGIAITISGAWHAGESVYRFGAGVQRELPGVEHSHVQRTLQEKIEYAVDPLQSHVILAGVAVAIALVSIGLSFRKITATVEVRDSRPIRVIDEVPAISDEPASSSSEGTNDVALVRSFNPDIEVNHTPFTPAGRFWLLASALALLTIAFGWWFLASDSDAWQVAKSNHQPFVKMLWNQVKPQPPEKINRRFAHVITGSAIASLPLVLAGLSRWAPRRKFVLSIVSLALVLAVAMQIWLGVLMLYDSPIGSIRAFNAGTTISASTQPAPIAQ